MASYSQTGIYILDSSNATDISNGGSFTTNGGVSIGKDIYIGGNLNMSGESASFADNVILLNSNPSELVDTGIVIKRYNSDYSSIIYSESLNEFQFGYCTENINKNAIINEFIPIRVGGINIEGGGLFVSNITATNLYINNSLSSNLFNSTNSTIKSIYSTSISSGSLNVTNSKFTNTTTNTLITTFISSGSLNSINSNLTNVTTNTLVATNSSFTLINSTNSILTNVTIKSIYATGISSGSLNVTNFNSTNITTNTLIATFISSGSLNSINSNLTNITTNTLIATNSSFTLINSTNSILTNSTIKSIYATCISSGSLNVTNSNFTNITTASFNTNSLLSSTIKVTGTTSSLLTQNGIYSGIYTDGYSFLQMSSNITSGSHILFSTIGYNSFGKIRYNNNNNNMNITTNGIERFSFVSNGDFITAGDISSFNCLSDCNLRQNVTDINTITAKDIIKSLKPIKFNWRNDIFNESKRGLSDIGFNAQDIENLIPEAVSEYKEINSGNVYKNIKHERLLPYIVSSIQNVLTRIESLETSVASIKQKLNM